MDNECRKEITRRKKRKSLSLRKQPKGWRPVELSLSRKEAFREAQRCLSLRDCEACEICTLFCPDLCITRAPKTGDILIDLDYCKGCGICASVCPKGAIQMILEEGR